MRTYQKIAIKKEQELLCTLQPKWKIQANKKILWAINTNDVRYELIAIGRRPNGIEIEEWSNPIELSAIALQSNDIFEAGVSIADVGKYQVTTKCYTAESEKFDVIRVYYDNVPDWYFSNCAGVEQLGATVQTITKKKTHFSTEKQVHSITARFYYKFIM